MRKPENNANSLSTAHPTPTRVSFMLGHPHSRKPHASATLRVNSGPRFELRLVHAPKDPHRRGGYPSHIRRDCPRLEVKARECASRRVNLRECFLEAREQTQHAENSSPLLRQSKAFQVRLPSWRPNDSNASHCLIHLVLINVDGHRVDTLGNEADFREGPAFL